jgi:short-subunit dehydrogenase/RimJ/RimL family protein N-acetyltransferase
MTDVRTPRLLLHPIDVTEGERIVARSAGPADVWADDFPFEGDIGAVGAFLRASAVGGEQRPFGYYLITRLDDGRTVGGIGFKGQPKGGCVEIGYGLAPSARGRGYAAEAIGALLALASDHGLSRVTADTAPDNIASQRALTRAGFRLVGTEGELRHYEALLGTGLMGKSMAVFGAGPGLGQAVARRYAREGYDVVLVARRRQPLELLAEELTGAGTTAHVITADLADTDAVPALAAQVRTKAGDPDALYYAPTPETGFVAAADLTPKRAQEFMPLVFYSLVALVQEFLPHMLGQGSGAILTAQGASTVQGLPNMSGPGPAQAAQRNYLQSLHAEVAGKGVYVGMLYIGAVIENSAFHTQTEKARKAGTGRDWGPAVNPAHLADLLWNMHNSKGEAEAKYPLLGG